MTTAGATSLAYADIVSWFYALEPVYRQRPSAAFIVSPSAAKALRNVLDTSNRPTWIDHPGNEVGINDNALGGVGMTSVATIFGRPVLESKNLGTVAATHTVGIFADWSKAFVIRVAQRAEMQVLVETFADNGQFGYIMWGRYDGAVGLPDAASVLTMHS